MAPAQTSPWPVLIACIGKDRLPTSAEIDYLASRIWREIHPQSERWESLDIDSNEHRQITNLALAAVGVPLVQDAETAASGDRVSQIGEMMFVRHVVDPELSPTAPAPALPNAPSSLLMPEDCTAQVMSDPYDLSVSDQDYAVLAAFRQDLRAFLKFSENAAEVAGVTTQQYQALLALRAAAGGQLSVGELAECMLLQPHSASGLLSRLEAGGMVERIRAGGDRRRVEVCLTDKGRRLLSSLAGAHRNELKRLHPMLKALVSRLD